MLHDTPRKSGPEAAWSAIRLNQRNNRIPRMASISASEQWMTPMTDFIGPMPPNSALISSAIMMPIAVNRPVSDTDPPTCVEIAAKCLEPNMPSSMGPENSVLVRLAKPAFAAAAGPSPSFIPKTIC
ncbi:MAG: hypothetical protein CM15mP74_20600 [Halieaceae bacterium]|nr:MAG: hypothetical protein CM15mP74_20600 [Halieaceae bacterium]